VEEVNPAILAKIDSMEDVPGVFKEFCRKLLGEEVKGAGDDISSIFQRLIEAYCDEPDMASWAEKMSDE